ncbi:Na(+) H(+) antiporter subunit B [Caenispirillum salinarum AK4]|uniref:Na(+) H(+) antiporter subunit B n=1 Tax=Caenispirillum salinarum AK4 TaxID=1238182 RepID=K9GWD5_9PROT|nr:Na(+)/H(+) antiporter subunit B [Caenispirillum salinarum]EKV29562.1 Na(+) H(+) antiporter subunit B [Caenispirillum salinarum AK4]
MSTLILRTMGRLLAAVLILFSLYMLLRGHNDPGGGFIGGLICALGIVIGSLGEGSRRARRALRIAPRLIAAAGLAVALIAGFSAALAGKPFLTGLWMTVGGSHVGTPILFDVGVYLVVIGATLALLLALEEDAGRVNAGEVEEEE